ncbi:hypothetical protein AK812_SmicGene11352 [Symbiodinium microadriaticum]|uniref:Uncharacterized protein n=1 Tax=Symbiodinium microadriaticum TaxID=2951 RepID=A0A1Q9EDJ9_SYMMI|nr:hypothetical protein AK812_SmicGene11352 [Symbiodinium microadriaticum]
MKLLTTDKRGERMERHGTLPLSDTTYDMKVMLYSGMDFRTWMDVCVAPEYYFRCNGRCSRSLADQVRLDSFQPVNLSMTLWAFARSGLSDERLLRAAAHEVKSQMKHFEPQQIAILPG